MLINSSLSSFRFHPPPPPAIPWSGTLRIQSHTSFQGSCWCVLAKSCSFFWDIVHFLSSTSNTALVMFYCGLLLLLGLVARKGCGPRVLWWEGVQSRGCCIVFKPGKLEPSDSSSNREVWNLPVDPEGSRGSEASIFCVHTAPPMSQSPTAIHLEPWLDVVETSPSLDICCWPRSSAFSVLGYKK